MPFRLLGAELQAPGVDRLAHAFGQAVMAREDVFQAFLGDQVERDAQAAQQLRRRRVREVAGIVGADHVLEGEVAAVMPCRSWLRPAPCWLTERKPRPAGSMKPFCEPLTRAVDAPFLLRKSIEPIEETPSTNSSAGWSCGVERRAHGRRCRW